MASTVTKWLMPLVMNRAEKSSRPRGASTSMTSSVAPRASWGRDGPFLCAADQRDSALGWAWRVAVHRAAGQPPGGWHGSAAHGQREGEVEAGAAGLLGADRGLHLDQLAAALAGHQVRLEPAHLRSSSEEEDLGRLGEERRE